MMDKTRTPTFLGIATGLPVLQYSQERLADYLGLSSTGASRQLRKIFDHSGVAYRYSAVDEAYYSQERTTQDRNARYMAEALPLGEATIRRCLENAGCCAEDIDDFFVVSCTGYEIPGLDLHLAARLGMRADLHRTCILGMGCYGAFPALLRARETAAVRVGRTALVLALELCSLHMQSGRSIENVVTMALFGDGAAAVLVGSRQDNRHKANRLPHLLDSETYCDYQTLDHMAFHLTDHGFQMHLTAYVPDLLAAHIESFVDKLLARHHISRNAVRFWGIHPGSSKILDYVQARLGLADQQMSFSRHVLHNYGNMSSPTILFVLDEICRCGEPSTGDYGVLLAFGPGLTMESLLVQW
jgi:predicted naringenin-chalcone synthase